MKKRKTEREKMETRNAKLRELLIQAQRGEIRDEREFLRGAAAAFAVSEEVLRAVLKIYDSEIGETNKLFRHLAAIGIEEEVWAMRQLEGKPLN
jgi:hypothetical protein